MNDQKIIDASITLRENETFNMTILPIKNKYGELIRVIIVIN